MSNMKTSIFFSIMVFALMVPLSSFAHAQPNVVPGKYIVILNDDVSPMEFANSKGAVPEFVYEHAVKGFSAQLSPVQVKELAQDSRVKYVEQDQIAHIFQTLPFGIDRIDADSNSLSDIGGTNGPVGTTVVIMDTGIDLDHSDLNVNSAKSVTCFDKSPRKNLQECKPGGDDDNGHGTHVAGTVGAIDDGNGVVGVAPGVDLWSVKVLDNRGSGYFSWIILGVDYVTANAADVDVVNMSLGCGGCTVQAFEDAINASVESGVTYVVAAGNSATNAQNTIPASYDSVITVSALADFDGTYGGQGSPTCRSDVDDTFANFSNYGSVVDVIAPGVCIESTWKDGGYNTISGTSMATPHVAGAMALYLSEFPSKPTSLGEAETLKNNFLTLYSISDTDEKGYTHDGNDEDGIREPLLYVGGDGNQEISDPTKPAAPRNLQAEAGDMEITLTWDAPFDGGEPIGNYHVYNGSDTLLASLEKDEFTFIHTGLNNGQEYSYKVTAENIKGESEPSLVSTTPSATSDPEYDATFTYTGEGGKNADKHLIVTIHLTDAGSNISGTTVEITLSNNQNDSWNGSGTTGGDGKVSFTKKNASTACYTTSVISIAGVTLDPHIVEDSCTPWP
ncbi:MAG: S8 family serine peptidase [Nitrosopumilaceae archaeon]|uniref:S8 family serine peptidase n=1 Tax=Candidatus Nitrosomaritimum aestuariumsis TaxID=3342354 RepID=A0AC60W562_9ARCH|nr:S8 family serine peptidase [Nitrosopumilaceae archaeon]